MKKIATFAFILAALSAAANLVLINVGTNADVGSATLTVPGFFTNQTYSINVTNAGTGERIGRTTWENLNNNQLLLLSLANQALATQAVAVASSRLPANLAENSATVSLFSTNNFSFANSNYWGTFSNVVWSFTTTATDLGTNQPTTNFMSFDGTTWMPWYFTNAIEPFYVTNVWTNYVGTNSLTFTNTVTNYDALPIQLSTLTAAPATGTVSIVTIDHPELIGHLNTFYGQSFDFTGASLSGLPTTTGLTTNIQVTDGNLASPSTNTLYFTNGILKAVTSP